MNKTNKSKQKKFKRKYQIFSNELAGISPRNWKPNIYPNEINGMGFCQIDELINSINRGNKL